MPRNVFRTDIRHGRRYRDVATGFVGTAIAIHFYEHGCERVSLKGINTNGEVVEYAFDAPELEDEKTGTRALVEVPGGPHDRIPPPRR